MWQPRSNRARRVSALTSMSILAVRSPDRTPRPEPGSRPGPASSSRPNTTPFLLRLLRDRRARRDTPRPYYQVRHNNGLGPPRVTVFGVYHALDVVSRKNAFAIKELANQVPCHGKIDRVRLSAAASATPFPRAWCHRPTSAPSTLGGSWDEPTRATRPDGFISHRRERTRQHELLVPKVGLESSLSCEDRILSPGLLPYPWYWKHVAVIFEVIVSKAFTMLP